MKKISKILGTVLLMGCFVGCGGKDKIESKTLRLPHNLSEDHPVHIGLQNFAKKVEEKTNGEIKVQIFPNAVLGDERTVLEQLQNGVVDMTKVSAAALENFAPVYSVFSLPYVFESEDHYYKVMGSEAIQKMHNSTQEHGFYGLTFYDSGARSFYTKNKAINTPDDLKGLKIRVQNSQMAIEMVQLLGGAPTPMPYGDVYTAIQQSVIDGAESNITALTTGRHGEVAKVFSYNEHTRVPDFLIISTKTWDGLSSEQQKAVKEAANESTQEYRNLWNDALKSAEKEAVEKLGVKLVYPDQKPFREKVAPMIENAKKDPVKSELITAIENIK